MRYSIHEKNVISKKSNLIKEIIKNRRQGYPYTICQHIVPTKTTAKIFIPNFFGNANDQCQNKAKCNTQKDKTRKHNYKTN